MSRISVQNVAQSVRKLLAMDVAGKAALADEVYRAQPNMLAWCLALQHVGVSLVKMDFVLEVMLVCFQAMKESMLAWPVISVAEQDRQAQRFVAMVQFSEDLSASLQEQSARQYADDHLEPWLWAYVLGQSNRWLATVDKEESDKYVIIAVANLVDCMAHVPLETARVVPGKKQRASK
jgi:hypothetical protein